MSAAAPKAKVRNNPFFSKYRRKKAYYIAHLAAGGSAAANSKTCQESGAVDQCHCIGKMKPVLLSRRMTTNDHKACCNHASAPRLLPTSPHPIPTPSPIQQPSTVPSACLQDDLASLGLNEDPFLSPDFPPPLLPLDAAPAYCCMAPTCVPDNNNTPGESVMVTITPLSSSTTATPKTRIVTCYCGSSCTCPGCVVHDPFGSKQ